MILVMKILIQRCEKVIQISFLKWEKQCCKICLECFGSTYDLMSISSKVGKYTAPDFILSEFHGQKRHKEIINSNRIKLFLQNVAIAMLFKRLQYPQAHCYIIMI